MPRPLVDIVDLSNAASSAMSSVLEAAVACAAAVHHVDDTAPVLVVEIDQNIYGAGRYYGSVDDDNERIALHPLTSRPGLTLLHELGHYVDHSAIRPRGEWASSTPDLGDWRAAVDATEAIEELRRLQRAPPMVELTRTFTYLLQIEEIFARSYAQWVAVRTGNETLLDELTRSLSTLHYPEQWGFEDFAAIADELDRAFAQLDLTP